MLLLCLLSGFSVPLGLLCLGHSLESWSMPIQPPLEPLPPSLSSGRLLDIYLFRVQIGNVDQKAADPSLYLVYYPVVISFNCKLDQTGQ